MAKPSLKLSGRSGCKIELLEQAEKIIVRKYSSTMAYNKRLMLQAEKQKLFRENNQVPGFDCPSVFDRFAGDAQELSWFDMDYVHADKYSDYLERIPVSEVRSLAQSFTRYFDHARSVSKTERPDLSIFEAKKNELLDKVKHVKTIDPAIISGVRKFLSAPPAESLYYGFCHGDFTLSNILFGDHNKIMLVDFLDTFYESPIQDIVKLRQDTCYGWTLMIDHDLPQVRYNKLVQIFEYIDRIIADYIQADKILSAWYPYFQMFNLFRILPYLSREEELIFVQSKLRTLL